MTLTVVSGGQDGADVAGWRAAQAVSWATAGWMPKGFLTESGPRPGYSTQYNARETASADYPERTRLNVRDSDATIIFRSCRAKSHRGCTLTAEACVKLGKPYIVIPVWSVPDAVIPTAGLAGKIVKLAGQRKIETLNVAGSRGSSDPGEPGRPLTGIEGFVFSYLLDTFTLLKGAP